jgi:hypothetical protein
MPVMRSLQGVMFRVLSPCGVVWGPEHKITYKAVHSVLRIGCAAMRGAVYTRPPLQSQ